MIEDKRNWKCFIGFHQYTIIETAKLYDNFENLIDKIYYQQCDFCGKVKKRSLR